MSESGVSGDTVRSSLSDYGLSDTNTLVNRERLLYRLCETYSGDVETLIRVLSTNPDRESDKKTIMRKTGKESSVNSTSNQGLGDVIDNMPYYVDSCAWWIKGWDSVKFLKAKDRDSKRFIQDTVGMDNINPRTGLPRTRRKQVPRRIR